MQCTITHVAVQFRDITGKVFPREETCTVLYGGGGMGECGRTPPTRTRRPCEVGATVISQHRDGAPPWPRPKLIALTLKL
jgi:hypothetical protein